MLSLFQAPESKTVVQSSVKSDAKNAWGRTATAPFRKSRASYFRFGCYIFATSLGAWHRLLYASLSRRRFLSLLTCGEEGNTTLLRMPACGAHLMHSCTCMVSEKMKNQLISVANYGPKMSFIFLFCLTFVVCLPVFEPAV